MRLSRILVGQAHFEALLQSFPSGILLAEAPSGAILFGNQQIEQMAKHPVLYSSNVKAYDAWVGWHLDGRRVQPEEWPLARAIEGQPWSEDYLYQRGDQRVITVRIRGAPLRDPKGKVLAGMITVDDMNSHAQQEQERESMLQMVTHELRGPLAAIQLSHQLMQRRLQRLIQELSSSGLSPCFSAFSLIEAILNDLRKSEDAQHIQKRLLEELSESLLIEMGQVSLRQELCNLQDLLEQAVQEQERLFPKRVLRRETLPSKSVLLFVDPFHIHQVMTNYLSNALKYSPEEEEITIGLVEQENGIVFWVHDHGPGLTPEEQQRVWDRFYRVPHLFARGGQDHSLGLGLYICRIWIEQHHGQVGVASQKGGGSCFWFTLPKQ